MSENREPALLGKLVEHVVDRYQEIESTLPLLSRDMSHSERRALKAVAGAGRITIGAIGEAIRTAPSTTTWIVGGMVERDIFRRTKDAKDKRRIWIELSEKGKALSRLMERIPDRIAADLLYKLEEEKRGAFAGLAGEIVSKIGKHHETGAPIEGRREETGRGD